MSLDLDLSEKFFGSLHLSPENSDLLVGSLLRSEFSDLSSESLGLVTLCLLQLTLALSNLSVDLSDLSVGLSGLTSDSSREFLGSSLFLSKDLLENNSSLLRADLVKFSDQPVDLLGCTSSSASSSSMTSLLAMSTSGMTSTSRVVLDDLGLDGHLLGETSLFGDLLGLLSASLGCALILADLSKDHNSDLLVGGLLQELLVLVDLLLASFALSESSLGDLLVSNSLLLQALRNLDLSLGEDLNQFLSLSDRLASGDSSFNSLNTLLGNSDLFLNDLHNLSLDSLSLNLNLHEFLHSLDLLRSMRGLDGNSKLSDLLGARLV